MDLALRALNRFGLGARIGERGSVGDPRRWLLEQLDGRPVVDSSGVAGAADIARATLRVQDAQRSRDEEGAREARRALQGILVSEAQAALRQRVITDAPFAERLVAFWSNHLCVSVAAKQAVVPLAGLYEREVIRPHVFGRFADMVLASARHPAMLLYLDNFQSVGPASPGARQTARRGGRERGLNENYARELLELHTVGVGGGYAQADVEELARTLTGWTVSPLRGEPDGGRTFLFRRGLHQPGDKTVMGKRYRSGEAEGARAIRDLCAHPSTARFLAEKLVRHFVADEPPPSAVDRIAMVFSDTDGDLREVSRALVELDDAWDPGHVKIRSPQDWLVAALRAIGVRDVRPLFAQLLRQLRHPMWAPGSPQGYGDRIQDWADPDGLMNRAELARTIAGRVTRSGPSARRLLEVADVPTGDPLTMMLEDDGVPADERVALVLGGPAFQWR